eukprot:TRINITY_DN66504_c4_g4_i1.p2 TRINITY_DN66504_c4_g4~~TRINITY_DN66504_c4_g4_i1.p2  ORF type:complete len:188 (-),score=95.72 TRINITY_DN66504_c4_g4_i1:85-648(-)
MMIHIGKSSITMMFVKRQFLPFQESTIGAAFLTQTVVVGDWTVKFEIWDTAGQERYHSLAPMYYRGAAAAIVVYDITSRHSFVRAKSWVKELQMQAKEDVVIALCGNKVDLEANRQVDTEEAKAYADEQNIFLMETSAKTNHNVTELFTAIARKLPKNNKPAQSAGGNGKSVQLIAPEQDKKKKKCC